jgi:hypothetical protein
MVIRSDVEAGDPLPVVVGTTQTDHPLPDDYVLLGWHANGRCRSKLRRETAIVCGWVDEVDREDIQHAGGCVTTAEYEEIMRKVALYHEPLGEDVTQSEMNPASPSSEAPSG